jgi:uncharacterized protein (TIGR02145 family)
MKRYITLLLSLLLLISVIKTNGQILITSSDSISLEQDTVIKLILPEYRGNLSWELSLDKKNWVSLNIESDSLNINLDTEAYYRAKIVDGACAAYFSDTIKIDTDSIETDSNSTTIEMAYPDSVGVIKEFIVDNDTIFCNKIDNKYIFQGDIILTEKQLQIDSLKGATLKKYKLWPNNTVYYIIDNNLDSKGDVLQAINHWKEKTTLNFIEWTGQENYISFKLGDGTYSNLGMIGGQQEISIASNADLRMVIHEIGHAVGLIHEHSRAKRNDYIDIKWSNIKLNMWSNFIIEDRKNQISQYDDFDFYSVMLYPCFSDASVAKNPSKPIITKRDDTFWNSRSNLSQGDINTIKFLYPPINQTGTFTDSRDGHVYKTIKIGNQTWMAENLAYLPSVSPSSSVSNTDPYYYVYDYQGINVAAAKQNANYTTYGVLYNWPAAKAACPPGWHLPTDAEWTALENYLIANGYNYDGTTTGNKIAKSLAATTHWNTYSETGTIGNNLSLNNKSGLSALPGGYRYGNGNFYDVGNYGYWWSSTEGNSNDAWDRHLYYNYSNVGRSGNYKEYGFSVRCVRD